MGRSRTRDSVDGLGLLRSDMDILIYEANLSDEDTLIAQLRYLHGLTTLDIAGELSDRNGGIVDRKTVAARLKSIAPRLMAAYDQVKGYL